MSGLDEIFGTEEKKTFEPYNKEDWVKQKQGERAYAFELIDTAALSLSFPEKLMNYLTIQSRFDKYSVGNALLVAEQRPDATRLCDAKTWQKNGTFINKGEKGIIILEPGEEFTRDDGTVGVSYNSKKVFDISQTDAKTVSFSKRTPDEKQLVKALNRTSPVQVQISENVPQGKNAVYNSQDKTIYIRQGMNGTDIFRALATEIARAKIGSDFKSACVAFIVCKRYGIEPMPPIGKFEVDDAKSIRAELKDIRDNAGDIITTMAKSLEAKAKSEQTR